VLNPILSKASFTKEEDKLLLRLASEHRGFAWEEVAARMGEERTAWRCYSRYQRSLNPTLVSGEWTQEEVSRSHQLLAQIGGRHVGAVTARLGEGRLVSQVLKRLADYPGDRAWTALESRRLALLVQVYGERHWKEIEAHMPGRSARACTGHFRHLTNQKRRWTEDEDTLLLAALRLYGPGRWTLVSQHVPGRTASQCSSRFSILNPEKWADVYSILLATKKKMLRSKGMCQNDKKVSKLLASDFNLHLFSAADGAHGAAGVDITTGDPRLDKHLSSFNRRRHRQLHALQKAPALEKEAVPDGQSTAREAGSPEGPLAGQQGPKRKRRR